MSKPDSPPPADAPELQPEPVPAATMVWLATASLDHRLHSRNGDYPDIGPEGVEMSTEQADVARADAELARLELKERQ